MKKILIFNMYFIIFALFQISCTTSVNSIESDEIMNGKPITIIEFDSCEYVGFYDGSGYHYT